MVRQGPDPAQPCHKGDVMERLKLQPFCRHCASAAMPLRSASKQRSLIIDICAGAGGQVSVVR